MKIIYRGVKFKPQDLWVGLYYERREESWDEIPYCVYVCIIPMFPLLFDVYVPKKDAIMEKKNRVEQAKSLTFYMGDKDHEELFAIVREACRKDTKSWRAYERLHAEYQLGKLIPKRYQS